MLKSNSIKANDISFNLSLITDDSESKRLESEIYE